MYSGGGGERFVRMWQRIEAELKMEVVTVKYDSKNPNKKLFHLSYYKLNALFFAYVTGGEKG